LAWKAVFPTQEEAQKSAEILKARLKRQLVYVYRAQRPLSRVVTAFIDVLTEELKRGAVEAAAPKRLYNRPR
jgi:DNA-binding transcriptional LysR family regulator